MYRLASCLVSIWTLVSCSWGLDLVSTEPRGVTLTVYDTGFALVQESRQLTLSPGEHQIRFLGLPSRVEPTSISFVPTPRMRDLQVREQRFDDDMNQPDALFLANLDKKVEVQTATGSRRGTLLAVPAKGVAGGLDQPLVLRSEDGSGILRFDRSALQVVRFLDDQKSLFLEPTLSWNIQTGLEGPAQLRLAYQVPGLSWSGFYELVLTDQADKASLNGRLAIENETGGTFNNARLRFIVSEKGSKPSLYQPKEPAVRLGQQPEAALRYTYGKEELMFERSIVSYTPVHTFDLKVPVTLVSGRQKFVQWCSAPEVTVKTFHVYDGVKVNASDKMRRNDWTYGTRFHTTVETHVAFENSLNNGLGLPLPPGKVRLYRLREDEALDLLGEAPVDAVGVGDEAGFRLGPSRGLLGARERKGYREVIPFHEYEETFEIRLENNSEDEAEVRVVEHLYRWPDFEIIKSDLEFRQTGGQTIEFKVILKAGGQRDLNYTVRYRW